MMIPSTPIIPQIWTRLEYLDDQLSHAAQYWAWRTGEPQDDIKSCMILAIAEKAVRNPNFIESPSAYVVKAASNEALRQIRREWRHGDYSPLDDESIGIIVEDSDHALLDAIATLPSDLAELVRSIVEAGDIVLKQNGTLNISALARHVGQPERTVNRQIHHLRAILQGALW